MKNFSYLKITLLFLMFLLICSLIVIFFRVKYFQKHEEQLLKSVEETINENANDKEVIIENGKVGIIEIPSIDVKAPIYEGTSSDILKFSVGHFEETSLWSGNVAFASHNRGSYAHYFSRINELKNGDEIIYITNMGERRYEVIENKIIEETNVEILKNTNENIVTLITCVTGQKDKRQCVIGKEIN